MGFQWIRHPAAAALARHHPKSMITILMLFLLCPMSTVQGTLCTTQCTLEKSRCTGECTSYATTGYWHLLTSCVNNCSVKSTVCLAICMELDGGGANNELSMEQQEFVNQCEEALSVANADGDEFLTLDEFRAHTQAWTTLACPNQDASALAQEEYYDATAMKDFFANLSCAMCTGLLDPFNPSAWEGDFPSCGCMNDGNPMPIYAPYQTAAEANAYCALTFEIVFVQCVQPLPTCLKACRATRDECVKTDCSAFDGRDFYVQCLQTCDPIFYACVRACG